MDGDSAVDLQEMPVCMNCRILVFRSPASKNGARAAKRKPVHPKHRNHLFFTEEPRQCHQTLAAPVPPPVMEMMETILEFEEDEENCST